MRAWTILAIGAALAGCGRSQEMNERRPERLTTRDVAESAVQVAVASPRIAYSYRVGYRFDRDRVGEVQAEHVALCRKLGPARCVVVKTDLNRADDGDATVTSEAQLRIDARLADRFNDRLDAIATAAGARLDSRHTVAEDVTKQVVDTDARVRAKQALADRLLRLIDSGSAKVGELVEAERAFAAAQEELDAARNLQAELARRVAMSDVAITYTVRGADGVWSPITSSLDTVGPSLTASIGALITFLVVAAPWAALLALLVWLRRRLGWRWPFRRRDAA